MTSQRKKIETKVTQALQHCRLFESCLVSLILNYLPPATCDTWLHEIVADGNFGNALIALQANIDPNTRNRKGATCLMLAVQHKQQDILRLLQFYGAASHLWDHERRTAWYWAVRYNNAPVFYDMLQKATRHRDIHFPSWNGHLMLLHAVCFRHVFFTEALLQANADPNARIFRALPPLHRVCAGTNALPLLDLLLKHKACVNAKNYSGHSPLGVAVWKNRNWAVERLLKYGVGVHSDCGLNKPLLHYAVRNSAWMVAQTLLNFGASPNAFDDQGKTALHYACVRNDTGTATNFLLQAKADPNLADRNGNYPLHLILLPQRAGHPMFVPFQMHKLLEHKANVDVQNARGETPLLKAFQAVQNFSMAHKLLSAGANPNLQDSEGNSPLHLLANHASERVTHIELLIEHKADTNAVNHRNETPLNQAVKYRFHNVAIALLDAKADPNRGQSSLMLEMQSLPLQHSRQKLLECRAHVNAMDSQGRTPLHHASGISSWHLAEMLLKSRADPNALDHAGQTPLHYASYTCVVRLLLDHKAPINARSRVGKTALYVACEDTNTSVVEMLLEEKAHVNVGDQAQTRPLHVLARYGFSCQPTVRMLIEYKADVKANNKFGVTALHAAAHNPDQKNMQDVLREYQ